MIQMKGQKSQSSEIENPDCPYPETTCVRYGKCSECEAYHKVNGGTPYCDK